MIITNKVYLPSYGPHGEPYFVRARFDDRIEQARCWTEREALDARDRAFDQGALSVHVVGLPCRFACNVPNHPPQSPPIGD